MEEDDTEEGRKARGLKAPREPTQEEIDEHMLTLVPYRSWCPFFCVKARGRATPHRSQSKEEDMILRIHWDYAYLNEEDKKEERRPILVMKDGLSGEIIGHMIWCQRKEEMARRLSLLLGRQGDWAMGV